MLNDNTLIEVANMVDHKVSYSVPEMNVTRHFDPFEVKKLPVKEIRALNYKRGGHMLLHHYLSVKNDELKKDIGVPTDLPEYDYTKEDIDNILLNEHEDVLRDTLDFAPEGIIELVKSRAFNLKIPDTNKRQIIFEMTGTDIHKQILLQEQAEQALVQEGVENTEKTAPSTGRKRRVPVNK